MGVTSGRAKKPEKMAEANYSAAPETGVPVLAGAAAFIECKVTQIVDVGGDHDIVVGEAINADVIERRRSTRRPVANPTRLELRRLRTSSRRKL